MTDTGKSLKKLTDNARAASDMLKALSHETRLITVCRIGKGERSVQELEHFLGTSQSNISQHLARLRDKGILVTRKEGNQVFYSIGDPRVLKLVNALQNTFC
jgi:DNA-binding transcriptional ArsR family regulator